MCCSFLFCSCVFFFFFNDTATTEIYTLSLHVALPIRGVLDGHLDPDHQPPGHPDRRRSEEHTSELQSQFHLVCRLLLEKKKQTQHQPREPNKRPINTEIDQLVAFA